MVGLLHSFAELGDSPEGEESDDSDRKVEHVEHRNLPFVAARRVSKKRFWF
jgi:hypothetical protein